MCVVAVGLIGSAQHIFHVGTNLVDNHHIRALALTDHHCSTSAKGNSLFGGGELVCNFSTESPGSHGRKGFSTVRLISERRDGG